MNIMVTFGMLRAAWRGRLVRWLDRLVVKIGGPSAYYEGIPARRALDDAACALDAKGIPREIDGWPLQAHQRIRRFVPPHGGAE